MVVSSIDNTRHRSREWFFRGAMILAAAVPLIVIGTQTLIRSASEWQQVYVRAGAQWLAGQNIYSAGIGYAYPPFAAMVAAPFATVPEWLSRFTWFAFSALAFLVMVAAAWRVATNGLPLRQISSLPKREWLAFACGLAISLGFIFNAFAHQQTDVLIGGLMIAGASSLRRKNDMTGGTLIGLAAAFKASPLLWAPYLFWRKNWAAATLTAIVALSVNLLPDLIVRPPYDGLWIQGWIENFIWPTQRLDADLGLWASAIEYNQSLAGTLQRLVNTELVFFPSPHVVARPFIDAITLKSCLYSTFALLIVVSVVAAERGRHGKQFPPDLPDREGYEISIVLILMLMFSPMTGRPHFGILIVPAFCLARFALATGNRAVAGLIGGAIALVAPPYRYLVPETVHAAILWGGASTAAAMLLWLGCVLVLCGGLDLSGFRHRQIASARNTRSPAQ